MKISCNDLTCAVPGSSWQVSSTWLVWFHIIIDCSEHHEVKCRVFLFTIEFHLFRVKQWSIQTGFSRLTTVALLWRVYQWYQSRWAELGIHAQQTLQGVESGNAGYRISANVILQAYLKEFLAFCSKLDGGTSALMRVCTVDTWIIFATTNSHWRFPEYPVFWSW